MNYCKKGLFYILIIFILFLTSHTPKGFCSGKKAKQDKIEIQKKETQLKAIVQHEKTVAGINSKDNFYSEDKKQFFTSYEKHLTQLHSLLPATSCIPNKDSSV